MVQGCSVGRIVHVKINGQCRPAIIQRVWDKETGCSNLCVFPDGSNDLPGESNPLTLWKTSVTFGDAEWNWHWPERD